MTAKKTLVLLGVGHTNAHVVKNWIDDPFPDCELVCVSRFDESTYSGMLPGTLGQQFPSTAMRINLPALAQAADAKLILSETTGLDLARQELRFADRDPLRFDVLSIGIGSMPAGWKDFADQPQVVPIKPMQTFLPRLHSALEEAEKVVQRPIRVSVVGGGVAGIEIALCLRQFFHNENNQATIRIITSSRRPGDGMRPRSMRAIEQILLDNRIELITGKRVETVNRQQVVTETNEQYDTDVVIWATGATGPPLLKRLGLQTDNRGFVAIGPTLQSVTSPDIFAVGDSGTDIQRPWPKAGVFAVRQAPILWHNLAARLRGGPLKTFEPQRDFLKLLNTGDGKALLEYGPFTIHAKWCLRFKNWIDQGFISDYQLGPSLDRPVVEHHC